MSAALHPTLRTPRLLLRPWRDDDLPSLTALNADPRVMEYFPAPLTPAESSAMLERLRAHFDRHGFGMWAVEEQAPAGASGLVGLVGLAVCNFEAHFTPCVEVGWRLLPESWGRGYATEAAAAALDFGFVTLSLSEIVAFTAVRNLRSRAVMERLGMSRSPEDDFDHPKVPEGHPLRRLVLHRMQRARWPGPQHYFGRGRTVSR